MRNKDILITGLSALIFAGAYFIHSATPSKKSQPETYQPPRVTLPSESRPSEAITSRQVQEDIPEYDTIKAVVDALPPNHYLGVVSSKKKEGLAIVTRKEIRKVPYGIEIIINDADPENVITNVLQRDEYVTNMNLNTNGPDGNPLFGSALDKSVYNSVSVGQTVPVEYRTLLGNVYDSQDKVVDVKRIWGNEVVIDVPVGPAESEFWN